MEWDEIDDFIEELAADFLDRMERRRGDSLPPFHPNCRCTPGERIITPYLRELLSRKAQALNERHTEIEFVIFDSLRHGKPPKIEEGV